MRILAHGAFGPFDEIVLVLAIVIFGVMLVLPTLVAILNRRQPASDAAHVPQTSAVPPEAPEIPELAETPKLPAGHPDHFRLD